MKTIILFPLFVILIFSISCDDDKINVPNINNPNPAITTDSSKNIDAHSVVVYGTINSYGNKCTYYFEFGTTISYGNTSTERIFNGSSTVINVEDTLLNLDSDAEYHFRLSCSYNNEAIVGDDKIFITLKDDYFPYTIGTHWLYSFIDVVNSRLDTIEVVISNRGTWEYTAKSGLSGFPTYTEGVLVSPSVVQMNSTNSESRIYFIPFVIGNSWNGPPPQYTFVNYSVTSMDSIVTPAGKFFGALKIHMTAFNGGNTTLVDDRVFVPHIGFVKRSESLSGAGIGTIYANNWILISFNIVP